MTLQERFDRNYEEAREDYPRRTHEEHVDMAERWTAEEVRQHIGRIAARARAAYQDAVNRAHYD